MAIRIFVAVLAIAGLIAVRVFEGHFYDPFLSYFKAGNQQLLRPDFLGGRLIFHHLLRILLNLAGSLLLIWAIFKNRMYLKISAVLISSVSLVALGLYLFFIMQNVSVSYQMLFFIRRFAIQPLLLFLLIPTFYYLNQQKTKDLI